MSAMKTNRLVSRESRRRFLLLWAANVLLLVLCLPVNAFAFDVSVINWAIRELCGHITGGFGALLTAVAILGAVVSAALGSFRVFFGAIIVGVGSYTVPNILTMYFPGAAAQCEAPEGGRASQGGIDNMIDINIPNNPGPNLNPGNQTAIVRSTEALGETDVLSEESADDEAELSWSKLSEERD